MSGIKVKLNVNFSELQNQERKPKYLRQMRFHLKKDIKKELCDFPCIDALDMTMHHPTPYFTWWHWHTTKNRQGGKVTVLY